MTTIGHPIVFTAGQFSGCTIRMELNEIQKADLGRKYAQVDRRPLDPPPVVQLKVFKVVHAGTEWEVEEEVDYGTIQVQGFICTVDLFPVPESFAPSQSSNIYQTPLFTSPSSSSIPSAQNSSCGEFGFVHDAMRSISSDAQCQNQPTDFPNDIFPSPISTGIVHRLGNHPITESSKQTQALAGATFVQAVSLEHQGKRTILFPFSDLAVKLEGAFILRYRVFDLFSYQESVAVVGAETYGGPFRVYATTDFPGLHVSTDLTKNLARWGVPVHVRETERRRKVGSDDSVKCVGQPGPLEGFS